MAVLEVVRKLDTKISRRALAPVLVDEQDASAFRLMISGALLHSLRCAAIKYALSQLSRLDDSVLHDGNKVRPIFEK